MGLKKITCLGIPIIPPITNGSRNIYRNGKKNNGGNKRNGTKVSGSHGESKVNAMQGG